MIEAATVAPQAIDLLLAGAFAKGLDVAAVARSAGVPENWFATLHDAERARVPATMALALWAELERVSGMPHWGLWLAGHLVEAHPSTLGGLLVQSAPTLGEGLKRMLAFERVYHGVEMLALEVEGDSARLVHRAPFGAGPGAAPAIDFGFAWVVLVARRTTGAKLNARRVALLRERPASTEEWVAHFGVEPQFGAPGDVLELDASSLDLPQTSADALIARLASSHAKMLLDALPPITQSAGLEAEVRSYIAECTSRGEPERATLAHFADHAGTPSRTVQRKLAEQGTTFAKITDDVRSAIARQYLTTSTSSIAEIAFALGFADQAAFHRAFVRWVGATPGAFRREARVGAQR